MASDLKRIVVSGANKGIGKAIVEALLERNDTFVYIASRDLSRGEATRSEFVSSNQAVASRTAVMQLDVTEDVSIRSCADSLGAAKLYAVVNNAGVWGSAESTLSTNFFGVHKVTEALLPHLDSGGRIVHISSGVGPMFLAKCSPDRVKFLSTPAASVEVVLSTAHEYLGALASAAEDESAALKALGYPSAAGDNPAMSSAAYGASKAFLNLLTLTQAASLAATGSSVTVNSCSPGFIETDMTAPFFAGGGKTAAESGALPPAAATKVVSFLLFGEGAGSGRYFGSDGKRSPLDRYRAPGDPEYTGESL